MTEVENADRVWHRSDETGGSLGNNKMNSEQHLHEQARYWRTPGMK